MRPILASAVIAVGITALVFGLTHMGSGSRPSARAEDREPTAMVGGVSCGVERWPVKTLDASSGAVNPTVVRTIIAKLTAIPAPATLPQSTRIAPVEETTYRLRGTTLVKSKLEADSDIHLVLQSPTGQTMIAEIPNPGCVTNPAVVSRITAARDAFVKAFGEPSSSWDDEGKHVTLAGVGFFDFQHGQSGVAPNAIELHPVISFRLGT